MTHFCAAASVAVLVEQKGEVAAKHRTGMTSRQNSTVGVHMGIQRVWRGLAVKRLTWAIPVLTLASGFIVAGSPGIASAADHVCGTQSEVVTAQTVVDKKPPGCSDFNLTGTVVYDGYRGEYWNGSRWVAGANGWHYVNGDWSGDVVLVSNVATGTPLYVNDAGIYCLGSGCHDNDNVWVDY